MGTITITVFRGEPNAPLTRAGEDTPGAGEASVSGGADLDGNSLLRSMQPLIIIRERADGREKTLRAKLAGGLMGDANDHRLAACDQSDGAH